MSEFIFTTSSPRSPHLAPCQRRPSTPTSCPYPPSPFTTSSHATDPLLLDLSNPTTPFQPTYPISPSSVHNPTPSSSTSPTNHAIPANLSNSLFPLFTLQPPYNYTITRQTHPYQTNSSLTFDGDHHSTYPTAPNFNSSNRS